MYAANFNAFAYKIPSSPKYWYILGDMQYRNVRFDRNI